MTSRLLRALPLFLLLLLAAPASADHGGPLALAQMSPIAAALVGGGHVVESSFAFTVKAAA